MAGSFEVLWNNNYGKETIFTLKLETVFDEKSPCKRHHVCKSINRSYKTLNNEQRKRSWKYVLFRTYLIPFRPRQHVLNR